MFLAYPSRTTRQQRRQGAEGSNAPAGPMSFQAVLSLEDSLHPLLVMTT